MRITSSGEIPIVKADFNDEPIVISLGKSSRIIEVHLQDTEASQVRPELTMDSMKLMIQPLLLNPGDAISILVVTTGGEPNITTDARITGVPAILNTSTVLSKKEAPYRAVVKWIFVVAVFFYTIGFTGIAAKGYYGAPSRQSVLYLPKRSFTIVLVVLMYIALMGFLSFTFLMPQDWRIPLIIAFGSGTTIAIQLLWFKDSRWVVYKEVTSEAAIAKLAEAYERPRK